MSDMAFIENTPSGRRVAAEIDRLRADLALAHQGIADLCIKCAELQTQRDRLLAVARSAKEVNPFYRGDELNSALDGVEDLLK